MKKFFWKIGERGLGLGIRIMVVSKSFGEGGGGIDGGSCEVGR